MFCAAFPPGWQPEELFDGVLLKTQPPGHHDIDPVVTLGGYQGKQYEGKVKSLEELAEDAEDDLRDQMIRQLKTSNDKTTIEGKPALITAQSYLRGSEPWRAREVRILRADGVVVELALRGSDKRFEGLLPEFENMIATHLRIYCDGLPAQSGQPK